MVRYNGIGSGELLGAFHVTYNTDATGANPPNQSLVRLAGMGEWETVATYPTLISGFLPKLATSFDEEIFAELKELLSIPLPLHRTVRSTCF